MIMLDLDKTVTYLRQRLAKSPSHHKKAHSARLFNTRTSQAGSSPDGSHTNWNPPSAPKGHYSPVTSNRCEILPGPSCTQNSHQTKPNMPLLIWLLELSQWSPMVSNEQMQQDQHKKKKKKEKADWSLCPTHTNPSKCDQGVWCAADMLYHTDTGMPAWIRKTESCE